MAIEPQVFDLLVYLLQHRDHVVGKDDLLASVWHGRAISESALFNRINAARSAIGDTGERQRLIKTLPRKGLRFVGAVREEECSPPKSGPHGPPLGIADKPSIAILPFVNLSGDPQQDYFSDGIVEDITTALSRNRGFFVIARNSSFTYRGAAIDTKRVAQELGVRYVLEGSVRKSGSRIRVAGQLIEAARGYHLWADKFDGDMTEIFELQDQIVTRVVGAIAPQLEKRKSTGSSAARPAIQLLTISTFAGSTVGTDGQARETRKPGSSFMPPWKKIAISRPRMGWRFLLSSRQGERLGIALRRAGNFPARRASRRHRNGRSRSPLLGRTCACLFFQGRRPGFVACRPCPRARCEFGDSLATKRLGPRLCRRFRWGNRSLNKAMRLNPLDPRVFLTQSAMAFAHFIAGRDDDAAEWATMALRVKPNWFPALRMMIASNAMRDQVEEAKQALKAYLGIDPRVTILKLCEYYPFRREADRQRLIAAMRKAGVPEQ